MTTPDLRFGTFPGLTDAEARRRLAEDGFNEIARERKKNIVLLLWDILQEPMFLLLVACGVIYLVLGDVHEALMLLVFVIIIIAITLFQKRKTERALEALRDLSSPRALVVRDGEQKRIPGREVVRGDILLLAEGDRVPADALLLSCLNMSVDESLLTGESAPVRKVQCAGESSVSVRPGGDDLPMVYSGTLIVKGTGIARVAATGAHTELGRIGAALHAVEPSQTLLEQEIARLVKAMAFVGLFCCALVVVVYGITKTDWLGGLLAGITLAMATLPEEFPVVLTVFLALGAWRMSAHQVLTRKVPAIETLGAVTVLCVDKTGTLTANHMAVDTLRADGAEWRAGDEGALPERYHQVLEFAVLASQQNPFDPMEQAINGLGAAALHGTEHLHGNWALVQEYPLDRSLLAMSRVWTSPSRADYIIASKGAPEAVVDLCHLGAAASAAVLAEAETMARRGLRVLGVAQARFSAGDLPRGQHDFTFSFLGLIGLADPIRPTVPAAIERCHGAGIRVLMITGDYPETARNIARAIGLNNTEDCITGADLEGMNDLELRQRIRNVSICARVLPEQKLRIVNLLRENGEIVAMTGDGVNDAPALKAAHVGIAMGSRGTDVAREAADMVLVDDDFSSIVAGVAMGRRIFDNLRKAMAYIFAVHVPITGMTLIPVMLGWPLILLPVHVLFLELIIDPACSVVFEAEPAEKGIMSRPPRPLSLPLFGRKMVAYSLLQGLGLVAVIAGIYWLASRCAGTEEARALTFTTMILANLGLILLNRAGTRSIRQTIGAHNAAFWWIIGGALFFLGLTLFVPPLRAAFRFAPVSTDGLLLCLAGGAACMLWTDGLKKVYQRWIS